MNELVFKFWLHRITAQSGFDFCPRTTIPHHSQRLITMKTASLPFVFLVTASLALANTAPTVVIQSAQMRPGTTLMDVVYRVNDPDDATVKTRALAFVGGVRSFANVIRLVTFL
jgi:hypothetical protein